MRKTSQDGGDTTSITSGIENEIKKSAAGIIKIKRNSIKRKVQNFNNESDDGIGEPLLQRENEKGESLSQSAKFLLSKTKTDIKNDKTDDKEKPLCDDRAKKLAAVGFSSTVDGVTNAMKDNYKCFGLGTSAVHNHMNTNVFGNSDDIRNVVVQKTQILVEIDASKSSSYNSGPLIFTTAKIHTDGTNKHMEPVQVTPVPILSTVEGSTIKTSSVGDKEHIVAKNNNTLGGEIKKIDTGLSTVFGNHFKGLSMPTDYSIIPMSETVGKDKELDNNITTRNVTNKINTATTSQTLKTETNNQKLEISTVTAINEIKNSRSLKHESEPLTSYHGSNFSTSINVDVNKNFEDNPNLSKQSDNVRSVVFEKDCENSTLKDVSVKVDIPATKQLHRQKTLKDLEDLVKITGSCVSEPTTTPTITTISNPKSLTKDGPTASSNSFSKSTCTISAVKPATAVTKSATMSSSIVPGRSSIVSEPIIKPPTTSSTAYNTTSTANVKLKSANATPSHTVNVMSIASQVFPSTTSEYQKSIIASGEPQKSTLQAGKTSISPVISTKSSNGNAEISTKSTLASHIKDNTKMKVSTSLIPAHKSPVTIVTSEKASAILNQNISLLKSMDISSVTTPSALPKSAPVVTTSNAIKTENSSITKPPSNTFISTGSAYRTNDSTVLNTIPHIVNESHTSKTISSHSVNPTFVKTSPSSVETRGTAGKSASSLSRVTSSSSSPSTNVTSPKITLSSSNKTNVSTTTTTGATSGKSTTNTSSATPKPSVTHNQNQLERSDTKKKKIK